MARNFIRSTKPPRATVDQMIAWQALRGGPDRTGWVEATMRAYETPNHVDLAKRPGFAESLARILHG